MPKYVEVFVAASKVRNQNMDTYDAMPTFNVEVIKNPTPYEVKANLPKGARGIVDPKGDLYFEAYEEFPEPRHLSSVGHYVIEEILKKEGILPSEFSFANNPDPKQGIPIQREGDTNLLYLGESVSGYYSVDLIWEYFEFLQKKHPDWKFIPEKFYYKGSESNAKGGLSFDLEESFYTAERMGGFDVGVYKNPTEEEIRRYVPKGARGYISPTGDLYIEGYEEPGMSSIIHRHLLAAIFTQPDAPFPYEYVERFSSRDLDPKTYGVTVQRSAGTNNLYIGESDQNDFEDIRPIIEAAQSKNPYWRFINLPIRDGREFTDWSRIERVADEEDAMKESLNIVPTKDYHINNQPIKTEPSDEVVIDNGTLTVTRDGEVSTKLPVDKIDHMYFEVFSQFYDGWDKETFEEKTKDWRFFGDRAGGVAIREKQMNKIVAIFGHPRSVKEGFKKLLRVKGREPIWGTVDERVTAYLEQFKFSEVPQTVISLFEGKLPADEHMVVNPAFFKKIAESKGIPSIAQKWVMSMGR